MQFAAALRGPVLVRTRVARRPLATLKTLALAQAARCKNNDFCQDKWVPVGLESATYRVGPKMAAPASRNSVIWLVRLNGPVRKVPAGTTYESRVLRTVFRIHPNPNQR